MKTFIHPTSLVASKKIGINTRIWAFCNILKGAVIGEDCNICDHVFIENDVVVGNKVTIKCGVQLWDGLRLEDGVFIGPNVTFSNDKYPRSKKQPKKFLKTIIKKGASLGSNATILPGITIGENVMVGAGAVVAKNVPENAIVIGNPASIVGYVNVVLIKNIKKFSQDNFQEKSVKTSVKGVEIYSLPKASDMRGDISFIEYKKHIPFLVKRFFMVYNVPSKEVRGEHAHRNTHQFLICLRGSLSVIVDDGKKSIEIPMSEMNIGIHIGPLVWGIQYKYTKDAILLVFASDIYDSLDYIRDYKEFLENVEKKQ